MSTGIIEIVKQAAKDVMENSQMCDLRFGTVVSTSPLKVQVTNQFTIPSSLLIVPEHLTNHTVSVSIDWGTSYNGEHNHEVSGSTTPTSGGSGEGKYDSHSHTFTDTSSDGGYHNHSISGTRQMTINNALKVGDKVALLRKQGGQSYFILDRI